MLHIRYRFTYAAIAIFLAACSTRTCCQASVWEHVPNLPYTAQIVQTLDDTHVRRETSMSQMRDSQGRTRIEIFSDSPCDIPSHRPVMVNLFVPLQRQFIQLIPAQKIARVTTFPGTGSIPTHGPNPHVVKTTTEDLPGQMIQRTYAIGTQTTEVIASDDGDPNIVDTQETWVSPDLKIVILSRRHSTAHGGGETIVEVRQIDRAEPEAALFEIPADYKSVTVTTGPQ